MKVFTQNFNPNSNSGPNKFTRQLFNSLIKSNDVEISSQKDADLEFCLIQQVVEKSKPMVLRLDGIYFNEDQDYNRQNLPIKLSYDNSDAVIFQSNFNKKLIERWFGEHPNSHVVHNAFMGSLVRDNYIKDSLGDRQVWSCASSWRPHKRIVENVRFYLENSDKESVLVIAGKGYTKEDTVKIQELINRHGGGERQIVMTGEVPYEQLQMLYDASDFFVHLAYLDHCPNVVVDALAYDCHVICSSAGGTKELIDKGTIIKERNWDYKPTKLYEPPEIDFSKRKEVNSRSNSTKTIEDRNTKFANKCLRKYKKLFKEVINDS